MLSKVLGWTRSQLFQLEDDFTGDSREHTELLALHEYNAENGLDGPEHEQAKETPWRTKVMSLVFSLTRREFTLHHVFSATPMARPGPS